MIRSHYYNELKELARSVRDAYGLTTPRVTRSDLRRIYRDQGIKIDLWPHKFRKLRGAYFNDEDGATVMLAKGLPEDPMVFTMGHELKHHLRDAGISLSYCDPSNESEPIEIGAEVFAAELIYPEDAFAADMIARNIGFGKCTPADLVRLKRETRTTLSYTGLAKRAEFLGFSNSGALAGVKWKKLEEEIYGVPFYKLLRARRFATGSL
jgi:Zn-dependent peptidase ImmA (M78 family)